MKKKVLQRLKNARGFTLIELMATLVILSIILAIAVPAVGNITAKAEKQASEASIAMVENAAMLADVNSEPFTEGKIYTVPTLVERGYLKLSAEHELNVATNYVEKQADGTFKFAENFVATPQPNPDSDFVYQTLSGRMTILGYNGPSGGTVVIPDTLGGAPVVEIAWASFANKGITGVVIPASVTTIGTGAFNGNALTSVTVLHPNPSLGMYSLTAFDGQTVPAASLVLHAYTGNDGNMQSLASMKGFTFKAIQ